MLSYKPETIVAMICITMLETIALPKGVDGILLTNIIAVIAGLGGFWIGKSISVKEQVELPMNQNEKPD